MNGCLLRRRSRGVGIVALQARRLLRAVDGVPTRTGVATKGASRGDMGSGWGSTLTITQDARQLVVEQALFSRYDLQPPLRFVYALDGSETRNTVMMGHATQVRTSRATWDGAALRITTTLSGHRSGDRGSRSPPK